ncbi:MAG: signal peptidase II [Candidatus Moranbacteria bacterium]|nr:signal peptidase II [Candidatus Moranbacteria bacterium]
MLHESTNIKLFSLLTLLVFIDQLSKYLVRHLGGFYICNSGISFSIVLPTILFWFFWFFIVGLIIYAIGSHKISIYKPALYMILAGAISNVIDRLYFGCVIDFINIGFWSIFNLADAFITIGVIITLYSIAKNKN